MHTHVHMHVHLCTPIPAYVHLRILIDTYACVCEPAHTLKAHTHLVDPLGILSTRGQKFPLTRICPSQENVANSK